MSHGMCPECMERYYGKENWYRKMKEESCEKNKKK
jgi:hypothetical protein